jgi:hypothetical protein
MSRLLARRLLKLESVLADNRPGPIPRPGGAGRVRWDRDPHPGCLGPPRWLHDHDQHPGASVTRALSSWMRAWDSAASLNA